MRKRPSIFYALIFLVALFSACTKTKLQDPNSVSLHQCSSKLVEPYICFDSLLTDSRCPTGGVCVWRGNAVIKVTFHESGNAHSFILTLKGYPSFGDYPSDTTVNGYKISFTNLEPYPDIHGSDPSTKKASFSITR